MRQSSPPYAGVKAEPAQCPPYLSIKVEQSSPAHERAPSIMPHSSLPTFHNINPSSLSFPPLPMATASPSHPHPHPMSSLSFSPYASPRHLHLASFDGSAASHHEVGGGEMSGALSLRPSSSSSGSPDDPFAYMQQHPGSSDVSAEEMARNHSVMMAMMSTLNPLNHPMQQYHHPHLHSHAPHPSHGQPVLAAHHPQLPTSPMATGGMPTPPLGFHGLNGPVSAEQYGGGAVPASPVLGSARSPSVTGSGRSKRQRMDDIDSRLVQTAVLASPQPLPVMADGQATAVSSYMPALYPLGPPMLPMMASDKMVEQSMLLDNQQPQHADAPQPRHAELSALHQHHQQQYRHPQQHQLQQHHQQQQPQQLHHHHQPTHLHTPPQHFINFNQLTHLLRGNMGMGMGMGMPAIPMATPVSGALPTISPVTLASPSSVFASARSVSSVSPAPSLSSVSSASSPSLATPTKSCFSRTSSSASSTPRTDDSSIDESFHSSSPSCDDSEPHLADCDKPFACVDCHKRFSSCYRLATHRRCHLNQRPYECALCSKHFNHKGSLTRHMRTHSGDKPHECDTCHKRFFQPGNLTVHIRTHTGEKPFGCDQCGKRFNHRSSLTVHSRSHS